MGGVELDPIADKLLKTVRKELGYREKDGQHTKFGHWYAERVQDPQYKDAPWCDMFIAWAADKAGIGEYVGQFAWTPSHAVWFIEQGAWTKKPEPGALVFFDWRGGKSYKGVDHVGIVERVEGGKIHTIEANVDRVWLKRKVRDTDKVVGYGLPRLVQANAERTEIRETEHPFPLRERADKPGSNPLDLIGTPVALLLLIVVTTVVIAFRLAGRRRGHHRHGPWNEPSAQPEIERIGPQYVMRSPVPTQPGPPPRESVGAGAPRRRRPYDPQP
ncbi:CHAP domain-containing protein [Nonomuraea sp. NPDC050478]|uniref:CHAP domain-containing protein n=1 Tax=Nonomuraea sp. NPDC050478 TaxID=3364365 RepID=UPI0037A41D01